MKKPRIDEQAVVADGAVVLGDVTIEKDVSIWYNAVIRGDVNSISIGEGTNIQIWQCCMWMQMRPWLLGKM